MDSSGCTPYKLKFEQWKIFSHSLDLVSQKKIDIIFYLNTQDHLLIKELATINEISFPLCFDEEDKFNHLNQLSKDFFFQTFLLDEMNRVFLVGNPLLSDKMRELYLKAVNEYSPQ